MKIIIAAIAFLFSTAVSAQYTGLWNTPAENGWGVTVTQQGSILYSTIFTYDRDGRPNWMIATCQLKADKTCSGGLIQPDQGAPFWAWNAAEPTIETIGGIRWTFTNTDHADFFWWIGTGNWGEKKLSRQVF